MSLYTFSLCFAVVLIIMFRLAYRALYPSARTQRGYVGAVADEQGGVSDGDGESCEDDYDSQGEESE